MPACAYHTQQHVNFADHRHRTHHRQIPYDPCHVTSKKTGLTCELASPTAAQSVTCGAHARAPFPPPTTHAKGREASTCGSVAPTGAHSAPFASRRTVVPHDAARAGAANIAPGGVIGEVVMKWAVWAERFVKLAPRANNDDKLAGTRLRHSQRAPGSDAIPPSSLEKARVGQLFALP